MNGAMASKVVSENTGAGRPSGSPGMTNTAGVRDGISSHEQIKDSHDSLGMGSGQGWRPEPYPSKSMGNRGFKTGP